MTSEIALYSCILIFSVLISAFSQILLKKAALKTYSSFISEYLNPLVIGAYAIFFAAVFLDMLGLKKVPVSFIPVIESLSYVFIIIFSRLFLKEKVSRQKLIGIFVILIGLGVYL